jgi:hypothetical protein
VKIFCCKQLHFGDYCFGLIGASFDCCCPHQLVLVIGSLCVR